MFLKKRHKTFSFKSTWCNKENIHFENKRKKEKRKKKKKRESPKIIGHDSSVYYTRWRKPVVKFIIYKYLSVIFLYTNEYSCVQDRGNSRMISQTLSNKLTQSTGAPNSRLPGTASPGSLRDGAQITNRVTVHLHLNSSPTFAFMFLSQRMSPNTSKLYKWLKLSTEL